VRDSVPEACDIRRIQGLQTGSEDPGIFREDQGGTDRKMYRKIIAIIIESIPVASAVIAHTLIFTSAQAQKLTNVTVLLAFLGFVFYFIGRRLDGQDRTVKILGKLDLLATASIVLLYIAVFTAMGM